MKKECMVTNTQMKNLRRNLMDEINHQDFSVMHMSIKCNIAYETLCGILRNKYKDMRLSTLGKIADGLGRSVEFLLTSKTEKGGVE